MYLKIVGAVDSLVDSLPLILKSTVSVGHFEGGKTYNKVISKLNWNLEEGLCWSVVPFLKYDKIGLRIEIYIV